jgi:hypothetical protein
MNATTSTPAVPALVARVLRAGTTVTPAGRWTSVAGAAYVAGWVGGLAIAPSGPGSDPVAIHAYYVSQAPQVVVQALLVHGLAGVALAVLALVLPRALGGAGRLAGLLRASGLAAAAVSLVQTAIALIAVAGAGSGAPASTAALVHAVDVADTVKLVLLAVFVTVVTVAARRAGMLPRWMSGVAIALVVLLPLGGASFLVPNGLLGMLLVVSLPVLLVWAGTVALLVGRRAH